MAAIKDKAGKINSMETHRPVALASNPSKVLERILLNKLEQYIMTTDKWNQRHKQCLASIKLAKLIVFVLILDFILKVLPAVVHLQPLSQQFVDMS